MSSKAARYFFYGSVSAFTFIFVWVLYNVLLGNNTNAMNPLLVMLGAGLVLALLCFVLKRFMAANSDALVKQERRTLVVYFASLFVLQAVVGTLLAFEPLWDLGAVFYGAKNLALQGTLAEHMEYFQYFPNTWGGLFVLYLPFKLLALLGFEYGSQIYYFVAMLLNIALVDVAIYCMYGVCKLRFGINRALFALFSVLMVPAIFLFKSPVFYSDTLSMFAPIAIYYLYLKQQQQPQAKAGRGLFIAMGLLAGAGYLIKGTPLLMLIAVALDMLFRANKQNLLKSLINIASLALSFVLVINAVHFAVYATKTLDRAQVEKYAHTPSLFIMMGLTGSGGYSPEAFELARSIEDPDEREQRQTQAILERIKEYGAAGLTQFFTQKSVYTWGEGTYGTQEFLDDNPVYPGFLHEFLLSGGKYHAAFVGVSQCVHVAILFLVVCSLFFTLKRKREENMPVIYAFAAVFVFFLFYEARARIYTNFYPVMLVMVVDGLYELSQCVFCKDVVK